MPAKLCDNGTRTEGGSPHEVLTFLTFFSRRTAILFALTAGGSPDAVLRLLARPWPSREEPPSSPCPALHFGPYRLEGPQGPLWHHAEIVAVPPKALAVLWLLASQAGQVVSKATLLDTVWAETVVSEGTLTTCLSLLRHALGEDTQQPRSIATVHRLGYRFVAPVAPHGPCPRPPRAALRPRRPRPRRVGLTDP